MAEARLRIPAMGRSADRLAGDLRRAIDEIREQGLLEQVRYDEWRDADAPEVWMRTTRGARVRWTVHVRDDGYEIVVRGPFLIHLRRPPVVRALCGKLEG